MEYGTNKVHDFAILTNFRQVVILACNINFRVVGETEIARIDLINPTDEDLAILLSFEKNYWVSSGKNNQLYARLGGHKRRIPVDEQLLDDMKHWRELLLTNIRKKQEFPSEIIYVEEDVQKFIDRLIFICFCEDKELEEPQLKSLLYDKKGRFNLKPGYLLGKIKDLFVEYNQKYNSDLFDHSDCDNFKIDDDKLMIILEDLREPRGRVAYDFKSIEADILGKVYENFIGHVQAGKKRFKEKEDIGKRKKGGIYYTPKYIVDYIVNNTVREYVKGKLFDEINKIRILDPACGSGSFLLRAFDVLVEESSKILKRDLTYEEKRNLMLNCIYGVDVDIRAVAIAKLNLSLKMASRGSPLPMLADNIRHGNSLIDDKNIVGWDAFVWEEEFKDIMDEGRFDVVIGNPPYVRFENLKENQRDYFFLQFKSAVQKCDIFSFFIEKALKLLKEGGLQSFIVSSSWLSQHSFNELRKLILNYSLIKQIIKTPKRTFKDAAVNTVILILQKEKLKDKPSNKIILAEIQQNGTLNNKISVPQKVYENTTNNIFVLDWNPTLDLIDKKIETGTKYLDQVCKLSFGIMTGDDSKFTYFEEKHPNEDKKVLRGGNIKRYNIFWSGEYVWYNPNLMKKHKNTARPADQNRFETEKIIIKREGAGTITAALDNHNFYSIGSTFIINRKDQNFSLKYILALLNSKLIGFWYGKRYKTVTQSINSYKTIPIKIPLDVQQSFLVDLVDHILSFNKQLNETTNPELKKKLQKEIEKIDNQIDELIYKLYNITEEEKKIIEESLK